MKPDPLEVAKHNEVTRICVIGTVCELGEGTILPGDHIRIANKIMDLFKRRGYEPQIRRAGQLKNGRNV